MRSIRRVVAAAGVTALIVTGVALAPASAGGTAPCPTGWGSLPKVSDTETAATLTGIRAGRFRCHDRVILDLEGAPDGYDVRYVEGFSTEGEGRDVPARGGAHLQVIVRSPAHDDAGQPTYTPADPAEVVPTRGARTLRQGVWLGSFEGQTSIGLGVRARLPYRVHVMDGPGSTSRVVVDIAHTW